MKRGKEKMITGDQKAFRGQKKRLTKYRQEKTEHSLKPCKKRCVWFERET